MAREGIEEKEWIVIIIGCQSRNASIGLMYNLKLGPRTVFWTKGRLTMEF